MFSRFLVALLGVVFLLAPVPAPAQEVSPTLQRIQSRGTFIIAYREDAAPFSHRGSKGVPEGFSIDLCLDVARAIAATLKIQSLPVKYLAVNSRTRFLVTEQGLADIVCGTTSVTVARMANVDFSMITFVTGARLMVAKNSPYRTIKDITAKPIGVIGNTTSGRAVERAAKLAKLPLQAQRFSNRDRALLALQRGEIGGFVSDNILLAKLLQSRAYGSRYKLVGNLLSYDPYALILPRNDSRFRYLVNRKLAGLFRTRKILKYHERWFKGINPAIPKLYAYVIAVQGIPEE